MIFSIPVGQNVPGTTKSVQQLIAKGVWSFRVLSSNRTGASRLQPGLIKTDRYRAAGHRGVPAWLLRPQPDLHGAADQDGDEKNDYDQMKDDVV